MGYIHLVQHLLVLSILKKLMSSRALLVSLPRSRVDHEGDLGAAISLYLLSIWSGWSALVCTLLTRTTEARDHLNHLAWRPPHSCCLVTKAWTRNLKFTKVVKWFAIFAQPEQRSAKSAESEAAHEGELEVTIPSIQQTTATQVMGNFLQQRNHKLALLLVVLVLCIVRLVTWLKVLLLQLWTRFIGYD